jgi:glycosyltransferase involved in cell wall biosynthesis
MASLTISRFDQFSSKQFMRSSGPVHPLSRAVSWRPKAVGGSSFATVSLSQNESEGVWSVIIPTYNRLPILTKCLKALEDQEGYEHSGIKEYEVVVVDDGSTDGTLEYLQPSRVFPHVKILRQEHGGATRARNLGVRQARGDVIVFIDSDLVVTKDFLREHSVALSQAHAEYQDDCTFTYGRVVNTANFENPTSEKFKLTDNSAAFFATGNVALSRRLLLEAGNLLTTSGDGPFDSDFSEYGWEDLELGVQ